MKSTGNNTDGIHVDGPGNDIAISHCDFTTGDDAIALNCPEGYSGSISRVSVSSCTFNSVSMMRMYTANFGPKFNIETVTVSNCSGKLEVGGFLIGIDPNSNPNSVDAVSITDCTITAPILLAMLEHYGSIALKNVTFVPVRNSVWTKYEPNYTCAVVRPNPGAAAQPITGSSLSFENCTIYRPSDIPVNAVQLEQGQVIGNLTFNGFTVVDAGSYSRIPELISVNGGSIGQLVLNSLENNNINALLTAGGFSCVRSVSGTGVLATGWKFPDTVMANGVPYISATTGAASVKIGGVIVPYPQR
jgi:hypothetical protein